jgi:type I restriction enzyme S subunit
LKGYYIPKPSLTEQREITTILAKISEKNVMHERKRDTIQELFKSLLQQLMTGQIRVVDLEIDTTDIL